MPPRILAKVVELDSLGAKYAVGEGAWEINEELQRLGRIEGEEWESALNAKAQLSPE